jgi:hypothetical protein
VDRNQEVPVQQELDFHRGTQLSILQDCQLPLRAKDKSGAGVRSQTLKMVLVAIDMYARGNVGGCFASVDTLAQKACISRRQCVRALEVLTSLGLVCAENEAGRYGRLGAPTTRRTIVWSELALLCQRGLFKSPPGGGTIQPPTSRPRSREQSATDGDHSAIPADHSAIPADQSAMHGTQNDLKRPRNVRQAPSDVPSQDVVEDGARYFFGDEVAAVRAKANELNAYACARTYADRELVLKVATLAIDGQLPEEVLVNVTESFDRKRDKREVIRNPCAWFQTTLRNQCQERGFKLYQLLARTDFPRELLAPQPLAPSP